MFNNIDMNPLNPLLDDGDITEILANGLEPIYIVKNGKLQQTELKFESEEQFIRLAQQIANALGRPLDEENPMVNLRMADGSRFNVVLPPISLKGPVMTLLKPIVKGLDWNDLLHYGALTPEMMDLLRAMMQAGLNIVVSGGTASGKTTVINALSEFIPRDERIVTIEQVAELQLRHPHVISLEARPADRNGKGEVTVTDLIINATMMRAERIIMGHVHGNEIWDMLQAMSNGYNGSLFGIHATSTQDVIERIEMMATAATNLPLLQIRAKMAQSLQVIIQQLRMSDGSRRIVSIAEVVGLKNNVLETQDIVRYEGGQFHFTGYVPNFAEKAGLSPSFFK